MSGLRGYLDREGRPISLGESLQLREEPGYERVARTVVGRLLVSTVWLFFDHSFGSGPPVIFETMVFPLGGDGEIESYLELHRERYSSEEAALSGHERAVAWARDNQPVRGEAS